MKGLRKLEKDLETFAKRALPFAVRNGLNDTAFAARKEWVGQVGKVFTLRNKWTEKSLRVEKAAGRNLETMQAKVGSTLDYMAEREQGGTQATRGKHGVPLPTSGAAGQGKRRVPRTRAVQRKNYLAAFSVQKKPVRGGRQRRNAAAIAMAARAGGGVVFLDLGKTRGLFRVEGRKGGGLRVRMIYDLSRRTVRTKPYPTLAATLSALTPRLPAIQAEALLAELRRHKVLGY